MNMRRMFLLNIIVLIVLVVGGIYIYAWVSNNERYLTVDNAHVSGQAIPVSAPASGKLVAWDAKIGEKYDAGAVIGKVEVPVTQASGMQGVAAGTTGNAPANAAPQTITVDITMPARGTIVTSSAVVGTFVSPGFPLAQAFNLDDLWVTANVKETDIQHVKMGAEVDVTVDAYPESKLTGFVSRIGLYTANTFSLLPQNNTTGNYTKVVQVIPVHIDLDSYKGVTLVPGMNVTVRIHK
ncbi:MAG: HlyD family secretion protein [Candidatus Carbobacillus altaicus]|nr:HlyD family secretion protein [Candidatus Carbobacillus altaicus]